ncbi:hypothetical protein QN277_027902 [Acacia crassicarpa]|uniref:Uncharacterized protein n=1 Tax=Acacia crassicarpa TaxID=499986 RepID=A0AAE1MEJ9_9FABA|nr:hypothetical protein QN277_027902 [Acacia crassicarpa]
MVVLCRRFKAYKKNKHFPFRCLHPVNDLFGDCAVILIIRALKHKVQVPLRGQCLPSIIIIILALKHQKTSILYTTCVFINILTKLVESIEPLSDSSIDYKSYRMIFASTCVFMKILTKLVE